MNRRTQTKGLTQIGTDDTDSEQAKAEAKARFDDDSFEEMR
jgi:hypothetical protein